MQTEDKRAPRKQRETKTPVGDSSAANVGQAVTYEAVQLTGKQKPKLADQCANGGINVAVLFNGSGGLHSQLTAPMTGIDDIETATMEVGYDKNVDLPENFVANVVMERPSTILDPAARWALMERFADTLDTSVKQCIGSELLQANMLGYSLATADTLGGATIMAIDDQRDRPRLLALIMSGIQSIELITDAHLRMAAYASTRADNNSASAKGDNAKTPVVDVVNTTNQLHHASVKMLQAAATRARILYIEGLISEQACFEINAAKDGYIRQAWDSEFSSDHGTNPVYAICVAAGALRLANNILLTTNTAIAFALHNGCNDTMDAALKFNMITAAN